MKLRIWGVVCLVGLAMWLKGFGYKESMAQEVTGVGETEIEVVLPISEVVVETPAEDKSNITEPKDVGTQSRLVEVLNRQEVGNWNGINTFRKMIRWAIERGVPASTMVLVFLLPLIATIVSILHYIFGLTGYGIFTPTMMAVTFLNTGIAGGLLLFVAILAMSLLGRMLTARLKLHYWPSRSINLTFVSLVAALLMFVTSNLKFIDISQISIFPIMFMVMLAEDFVRTQLAKSKKEAKKLTIGTLLLSIFGAVIMNVSFVQEKVLLFPEVTILLVLVVNLWVGSYQGIRFSEFKRFAKAIRN